MRRVSQPGLAALAAPTCSWESSKSTLFRFSIAGALYTTSEDKTAGRLPFVTSILVFLTPPQKVYFFAQQKRSCDLRFRCLCRNCVFWARQIPAALGRLPGSDFKSAADSESTSSNASRSARMILFAILQCSSSAASPSLAARCSRFADSSSPDIPSPRPST